MLSKYIDDKLDIEKIESFIVALRLMGYYVDYKVSSKWKKIEIYFSDDVRRVGQIDGNEVSLYIHNGEVFEVVSMIKNNLVFRKVKHYVIDKNSQNLHVVLDRILSNVM